MQVDKGRILNVLLIEDNPGDVMLTQEALSISHLNITLKVIYDGESALNYLLKNDPYQEALVPDLVLLDINLPRKSGFEILSVVKKNKATLKIPVVILTTSTTHQDIIQAYDKQANCFISKPIGFNDFAQLIETLEKFWFSVVQLPPQNHA